MKKIIVIILSFLLITGCMKDNKNAIDFKNEYESLNGDNYRKITIAEDNPYIKTTPEKIVDMLNNNETFFLYVGDSLCPWCRSVLEKSIEVSKKYNVDKIYYIEIWDDDRKEILRDKYELTPILTKTVEGTESYKILLEKFDSVLEEYVLYDTEGHNITTEEKRIFAPSYFFIRNGKVVKMIDGVSEKQTDANEELTEEMLKDEEEEFTSFFKLKDSCDSNGCWLKVTFKCNFFIALKSIFLTKKQNDNKESIDECQKYREEVNQCLEALSFEEEKGQSRVMKC